MSSFCCRGWQMLPLTSTPWHLSFRGTWSYPYTLGLILGLGLGLIPVRGLVVPEVRGLGPLYGEGSSFQGAEMEGSLDFLPALSQSVQIAEGGCPLQITRVCTGHGVVRTGISQSPAESQVHGNRKGLAAGQLHGNDSRRGDGKWRDSARASTESLNSSHSHHKSWPCTHT